jgi:hypothetical protein
MRRTGVMVAPKTWLLVCVGSKRAAEYAALFRPTHCFSLTMTTGRIASSPLPLSQKDSFESAD